MVEKRNGSSDVMSLEGAFEHEVSKRGRAGWQGNEISLEEASRGPLDREVNKKPVRPNKAKLSH